MDDNQDMCRSLTLNAVVSRGLWALRLGIASLALLASACGSDRADRAYLAALRGEETGMTREQQVALLDEAIELAPGRATYYETRAIYSIDLQRFDRALEDLDRDIELADRPYARFLRGLVLCEAGETERSLPEFDAAIALQPENTQFYRGRSLARAATGDAAGALADAEHLVAEAPQRAESFYARGVARARLGRERAAIDDFDRAAAMRPELVYVVEARAEVLERIGDTARALDDREALERLRAQNDYCAMCMDPFRY